MWPLGLYDTLIQGLEVRIGTWGVVSSSTLIISPPAPADSPTAAVQGHAWGPGILMDGQILGTDGAHGIEIEDAHRDFGFSVRIRSGGSVQAEGGGSAILVNRGAGNSAIQNHGTIVSEAITITVGGSGTGIQKKGLIVGGALGSAITYQHGSGYLSTPGTIEFVDFGIAVIDSSLRIVNHGTIRSATDDGDTPQLAIFDGGNWSQTFLKNYA